MRRSSLRLYAPFLALVAIQALVVLVAPSRDDREVLGSTGPGGVAAGVADGSTGATIFDPVTGAVVTGPGGAAAGGTDPATGAPFAVDPATGAPLAIDPATGAPIAAGDTSHCVGDRQFDILIDNPPCAPAFSGDNGGATYQGVTAETVKIIYFESEANAAVNAVLAPQGLAATDEELEAIYAAGAQFVNENYELYGRQIEIIRYVAPCPTSPPDIDRCLEAARAVVQMQPFMVIFGSPLYDRVFDEWARAGIVSVGGWHFDEAFFTAEGRRGFRYDVFMDGTRSAEMIAEYYCKKLAGGGADHAGVLIHPSVGGRDARRRLGISVPDIEANVRTAQLLAARVQACDPGAQPPVIRTYVSDIDRAAEQTTATTLAFINADVTTVVCMCDPIAPAFQTRGFTQQGYFPEYLMPGLGLLDFDKLGRLYDPQQMAHAFGPGHLAEPIPFEDTNAARMWRAVGRTGNPCQSCNLHWGYINLVGEFIQGAGPNLNPSTVERAALASVPYGGDRIGTQRIELGPGDYTALSDAREVYWCATCSSNIDGQAGAYVSPNGARRYRLGEWGPGLSQIPVAPS